MLLLRNLITIPTFYRNRLQKVEKVQLSNIIVTNHDDGILITCNANNKYTCNLFLFGKKIDVNKRVLVNCNCASFTYEFAYTLHKHASLLDSDKYLKFIRKPPRKKNIYLIPTGCKHLIALSKEIFKKQHKYEIKEK